MNIAIDLEFGLFELGLPGDLAAPAPWDTALNGEVSRAFLVERKIVQMNGRVEPWAASRVPEPAAVKSARPVTGDARALQLGNPGQVKIRRRSD